MAKKKQIKRVVRREIVKCYVRTYQFHDKTEHTFHTHCDKWKLPLESDKYGSRLEPRKRLVAVLDKVHYV
jgi:hypothetical protein